MRKWIRLVSGSAPDVNVGGAGSSGMTKRRRHYANDGVRVGIEVNSAAKHIAISAEQSVPGCVADQAGFGEAEGFVFRTKDTSKLRSNTKDRKIAWTGSHQLDSLGMISAGEIRADRPHCGNLIEDAGSFAQVIKLEWIEADVGTTCDRLIGRNRNELGRIAIGEGSEEYRVHQCENCRGCSDA